MTPAEERFMAFEGLVQWTQAVIVQAGRVSTARDTQFEVAVQGNPNERRKAVLAFHAECHFFAIAANKLIEFREWVQTFGLCASVDFSEVDSFPKQDITDLRNMREHVLDYFQGKGHARARWRKQTPDYDSDASAVVGSAIGGRLDWTKFGIAAERLLPQLLAEPIPWPT